MKKLIFIAIFGAMIGISPIVAKAEEVGASVTLTDEARASLIAEIQAQIQKLLLEYISMLQADLENSREEARDLNASVKADLDEIKENTKKVEPVGAIVEEEEEKEPYFVLISAGGLYDENGPLPRKLNGIGIQMSGYSKEDVLKLTLKEGSSEIPEISRSSATCPSVNQCSIKVNFGPVNFEDKEYTLEYAVNDAEGSNKINVYTDQSPDRDAFQGNVRHSYISLKVQP